MSNSLYYNLNTLKNLQNSILQILRERGDITVSTDANLADVPLLINGLSNKSFVSIVAPTEIAKCGVLLARFAVFSDVHVVSPVVSSSYATAAGNANGTAAMNQYAAEAAAGNLDFVVFCGDSYDPDNGSDAEYVGIAPTFDNWRTRLGSTPLYMIPGNHDFGSNSNWDSVAKMANHDGSVTFLEGTNRACYYKEINGDLYIWFGIFNSKNFGYTDAQYTWLFNLLESNRDKTRIFLFTHLFDGTVDNFGWRYLNGKYINNGWTSSSSTSQFGLIKNYKNLIWISGHSHTDWNFEDIYPTIKVHSNNTARMVSVPSMRDNNQDLRISVYSNMVVVEPYSSDIKLASRIYFVGNAATEDVVHVNYNLTGFVSSNVGEYVVLNEQYSTLLTLQNLYINPVVTVYMNGIDVTTSAIVNNGNGTYSLNIAQVTGAIDITATAISSIVYYSASYSLVGYTTTAPSQFTGSEAFNIILTPNSGFNPTPESINMSIASLGQVITNGVSSQSDIIITTNAQGVTTISCAATMAVGNITLSASAPKILNMSYNLETGFTLSNSVSTVLSGSSFTTTVTPPSGKTANIIIMMGGVDITSSCLSGNVITIASVTGNVSISITAIKTSYAVSYSVESGFSLSNNAVEVISGGAFTTTITPPSGKTSNVVVTMNGANITSSCLSGNVITIASVTGDVVITITGVQITFGITYNLATGVTLSNSPSSVNYGASFTTTVTPPSGKTANIIVMMGGVNITSSCLSGNIVTIASVTGIISIQITTIQTAFAVTYNLGTGFILSNNASSVNNGASYISSITIPSGATMSAIITMGGVDITSSCLSGNVITIASVTGDVSIKLTDVGAIYADYVKAVYDVTSTIAATQLLYATYTLSYITEMVIDGITVTPALSHTFATTGMHTVYMKMTDQKTHSNMFKDCVNLYSCILPPATATLSGYLFSGCTKLHDVSINCSIALQLTTYVLYNCPALAIVKFGTNVTGISQYNLDVTCTSLSEIYVHYPTIFSYLATDSHTQAGTLHYVTGANITALSAKFPNFTLVADL